MSVLTALGVSAAVAALAVGSVTGASMASASPPQAGADQLGARLTHACGRLPARITRVEKLQTRFNADVNTPGSVLYLQARIDKANAAGKTNAARLLSDRLAVRKDLDATLPDVLAKLQDAQSVCSQHSTPAPSASASS
jgi:hypothetical protein